MKRDYIRERIADGWDERRAEHNRAEAYERRRLGSRKGGFVSQEKHRAKLLETARAARAEPQDESELVDAGETTPETVLEPLREKLPNPRDPQDMAAYEWLKERGYR
jgi:hypothetical protein